ncbi:carboxylesterase [Lasiosphaeris hirsuta]|uniref:Carboxylic ester hydrolase n=1 Tax=Lasiosphaeris hirsuta TaxID=260670 RepID=A0AA40AZK5_9PEZI|nr:carboxylesterase [Lasiosphaeris hirsuta]
MAAPGSPGPEPDIVDAGHRRRAEVSAVSPRTNVSGPDRSVTGNLSTNRKCNRPATVNFDASILGNEDCLFLNIFAPANAKKLPVLFAIHGGGYGAGSAASADFSFMDQTVNNSFVSVVIQYRLGAFGFLSSAEVARHGTANAGLFDMRFALEWVQKYIERFGGDPNQVTIVGESAGGGSVMLMAMANAGRDGTSLFRRGIASSPYFPTQPNYDDALPTDYYLQFARRAGCLDEGKADPEDGSVFKCLQNAGTLALQNASAYTSYAALYGQWAFIPVTDGSLIRSQPNRQLLRREVNGERILTGNNANEGTYFVPQNITTEAHFTAFVQRIYPALSPDAIASVLDLYAVPANITTSIPKYDSDGLHPPYATIMSGYAFGWQQAANNLYAETTFVCPAYWLADAYTSPAGSRVSRKAWRYQFSVPSAFHGSDMAPLLDNPAAAGSGSAVVMDSSFRKGFQAIWGRFVVGGDPTISASTAGGGDGEEGAITAAVGGGAWRPWGEAVAAGGVRNDLLNVNVTDAQPRRADWAVADALAWEGGRGARCALWAEIGVK